MGAYKNKNKKKAKSVEDPILVEPENNKPFNSDFGQEEYDIEVFDEAYNEYLESGKKSRPINKLWDELNI